MKQNLDIENFLLVKNFDHWDYSSGLDITKILDKAKRASGLEKVDLILSYELPDYKNLLISSLLYLATKKEKGSEEQKTALENHRHLVRLFLDTKTLVGNIMAGLLLEWEVSVVKWYGVTDWKSVPEKIRSSHMRLSWGWTGMIHSSYFSKMSQSLEKYKRPSLALCAGVRENLTSASAFADFFEPRWPFEYELPHSMESVRAEMKELINICDLEKWSVFNENKGKISEILTPAGLKVSSNYFPYIRNTIGMILLTIASPNFFKIYN